MSSGHYEVWKYKVPSFGVGVFQHLFSIEMPAFARVLTLQLQHGDLCIWALVDVKTEKEKRDFVIVGTGHRMLKMDGAPDILYVGTFQLLDGQLVLHVFEFANGRNGR